MRSKKLILLFLSLTLVGAVQGQKKKSKEDIKESSLVKGVLDNGMHYYIMHNEEPKERASFYFAQNVGSILEDETQQGLAHFLEHMAFNGTKNFEGKGILDYLEKNGIVFGSEINAFTSFDETVYNINQVPVTNEKLLDSVLLVLHDWSGSLSLTNEEIDAERGVINEEWRSTNTAEYRSYSKVWTEGLLAGSKYAQRMPIGTMNVVNNFKYKELRDYYDRWYRPDKQAVVIVGDIDVAKMEKRVKEVFSPIALRKNLPERGLFDVPINDDLVYVLSTDKELGEPVLQYIIKSKTVKRDVKEQIKQDIIKSYAGYIFNNRLEELTLSPQSPVLSSNIGDDEFVRSLQTMTLAIYPKTDSLLPALDFAATEFRRFIKFGATAGEHDRVKAEFLTRLDASKKNIAKRSNDSYAAEIYTAFFEETPITDYMWNLEYKMKVVEAITNEELLAYLSTFDTNKGEVVGLIGATDFNYPEKGEVIATLDQVKKKDLEPYVEEISQKKLINEDLVGSAVTSVEPIEGISAKCYTLANGLKLALYPTTFDKEKVYMNAFSMGGQSMVDQKLLPNILIASYLASESGLGDLNKVELQKLLAGTNTNLGVSIGNYTEGLSGSADLKDLETLLQQVHLNFTAPRFEENAFRILKETMEKSLVSKKNNVQSIFQDSLQLANSGYSDRTIIFDREFIEKVTLEGSKKLFEDRIKNASDFTFVFVGDFKEDELLKLAEKYLGSIPGNLTLEQPVNHHMQPREGTTEVFVKRTMETPQTTVNISLTGDIAYSKKNNSMIYILSQLLDKIYMEHIREQEGGSYGVNVSGYLQKIPESKFNVNIGFNCNPDKTAQLVKIVFDDLDAMSKEVDVNEFTEIMNSLKKSIGESQENNGYWLSNISNNLQNGFPVDTKEEYLKMLETIKVSDIKELAGIVNKNPRIVEGILTPLQ